MGEALNSFVAVRYSQAANEGKAVAKKFRVRGFPTMLVVNHEGALIDEVNERDPKALIQDLGRIAEGRDTILSLKESVEASKDNYEAHRKLAGKLVTRDPVTARNLATRALQLHESNHLEKGADTKERATIKLRLLIANTYVQERDTDKALEVLNDVLDHAPTGESLDSLAYSAVMVSYSHSDLSAARALLERCADLELAESEFTVRRALSMIYMRSLSAETKRLAAMAKEDKSPEMLNLVAWECFERRILTEEATSWARDAVRLSQREPAMLDTLAELLAFQGKYDEAITLESEALANVKDARMRNTFVLALAKFRALKAASESNKASDSSAASGEGPGVSAKAKDQEKEDAAPPSTESDSK